MSVVVNVKFVLPDGLLFGLELELYRKVTLTVINASKLFCLFANHALDNFPLFATIPRSEAL